MHYGNRFVKGKGNVTAQGRHHLKIVLNVHRTTRRAHVLEMVLNGTNGLSFVQCIIKIEYIVVNGSFTGHVWMAGTVRLFTQRSVNTFTMFVPDERRRRVLLPVLLFKFVL